jgi:hypothetical protein
MKKFAFTALAFTAIFWGFYGRYIAASPTRTRDDEGSLGRLVDDGNRGGARLVD